VVAARPDRDTVSYKVHLGKTFDINGVVDPPTSFELLAAHNRFALHGTLQSTYSALTKTLDTVGMLVRFDGPDITLDEQTYFEGLSNELLVFVAPPGSALSEIMSVYEAVLVDAGTYRLRVIRNRFATPRVSHLAGADVFVIGRNDVQVLEHEHFDVNNTAFVKIQAATGQGESDLGSALEKALVITGAIYKSTPPTNLRVNGSFTPSYSTGQGVTIDWTLTEAGQDHYQAGLLKVNTILEFLDGAMTLLGTQTIAAGVSTLTLSNAALVAILGSEISFNVRAKTRIDADYFIAESTPITLFVQKV
jgi:hypothetical protein